VDAIFVLALAAYNLIRLLELFGGAGMSIRGTWRVVETVAFDMALASAYILFDEDAGEFAIDCLTGSIHGACYGDAVEFVAGKTLESTPPMPAPSRRRLPQGKRNDSASSQ
jgi:hypothetical protein